MIILPDTTGSVPVGKSAVTKTSYVVSTPAYETLGDKVTKITGKATLEITIQTIYKPSADPKDTSAYGRGTTKADKKSGNTSLRFHEGSHGAYALRYLAAHAVPSFKGKVGQSEEKYLAAGEKYKEKVAEYMTDIEAANDNAVACGRTKDSACAP